jgi:hypothetical protein
MARLMAIFCLFLLTVSAAQAAVFTFEPDKGEFVFPDPFEILQGAGKSDLMADWNDRIAQKGSDFLDDIENQFGVRDFEGYYQHIYDTVRRNPGSGVLFWRENGVKVEARYSFFSQCSRLDCSGLGVISAGGTSVMPRTATITFDDPQHLLYMDVALGAFWGPGDRIDIVTTTGLGVRTAHGIDYLDISGGNRIGFGAGLADIKSLSLSAWAPDSHQAGFEHIFRYSAIGAQQPALVPLPASLPLLLAGLGGLFVYRRRSVRAYF